jgi:hypothetical protein
MEMGLGFEIEEPERPSPVARLLFAALLAIMLVPFAWVLIWAMRHPDAAHAAARARLLELATQDAAAFRSAFHANLAGTDAEILAALDVAAEHGPGDTCTYFHAALTTAGGRPAIRDHALRFLCGRAGQDRAARRVLARFLATRQAPAGCRSAAFAAVLRFGADDEVRGLVPQLLIESNPEVLGRAAAALRDNDTGAARPTLEWLRDHHPRPACREAVRACCPLLG